MDQQQNKSFGPLIGIIVIIALIVIGGLYFWGGMFSNDNAGLNGTVPAAVENIASDIDANIDTSVIDSNIDLSDIEASLAE